MLEIYELTDFNSVGTNNKKKQIILTETGRNYKDYINGIKYRYNKKNPFVPNYIVNKEGVIYKTLKDNQYSSFMEDEKVDNKSIIICLENLGWFTKNPLEEKYINWIGDIYYKDVFKKKWRDHEYWDVYPKKQMISLSSLLKNICEQNKINKECIGHNVKYDGVEHFEGIVCRSNYDFDYKDVSPAFDFKLFKELLEND
jgi:N-acetyl-anhydromuramyl-L-alanine amidase AmpD